MEKLGPAGSTGEPLTAAAGELGLSEDSRAPEVEERGGMGQGASHPCAGPARVSAQALARSPPAGQGGVRETPTGLQRALPHHRGEGAQALRGARRQAKGVLRVRFQVIHHEGRGRVEGPRDLGEGRGERPGWGERQTDRQTSGREIDTDPQSDGDGEERGGKFSKGRGKEKEEERYSGT